MNIAARSSALLLLTQSLAACSDGILGTAPALGADAADVSSAPVEPDARTVADARAEADAASPLEIASERFHAALDELDRSCESESDCALMVAELGCTHCRMVTPSQRRGVAELDAAVAKLLEVCVKPDDFEPAIHCRTDGFRASCRAGLCERVQDRCSPGCKLDGDMRCVGPAGVVCEHCPPSASGPCKVRGQHCQYGECEGVGVCDVDRKGFYGERDAQVWMLTFYDCL